MFGFNSKSAARSRLDGGVDISIIIQGAVFRNNIVAITNNCMHWRSLFPRSQIILAVSISDVIAPKEKMCVSTLKFATVIQNDQSALSCLSFLNDYCDEIVFADRALPLPPIRRVTDQPNNINFQISAAKVGLAKATRHYTLRIRSDIIFADKSFLDQYLERYKLDRGRYAAFEQRVLISRLYTLNPYTLERMPFHYSDWFNFGLTKDIRQLWSAQPMSLVDALYYKVHAYAKFSNAVERLCLSRLAVEQHIYFSYFQQKFPELILRFHNDQTSRRQSVEILIDNFVLCDALQSKMVFEKYEHEFYSREKKISCFTVSDWDQIAADRDSEPEVVLSDKIREMHYLNVSPGLRPFPRVFEASELKIEKGYLAIGEIVATSSNGVVTFGPYDTLPRGSYIATFDVPYLEGSGNIILKAQSDHGAHILGEKVFDTSTGSHSTKLSVHFQIEEHGAENVEVLFCISNLNGVSISSLVIDLDGDGSIVGSTDDLRNRPEDS